MPTLHLIPNTLGSREPHLTLSATALDALRTCERFIVESENAARRLLKDAVPDLPPNAKPMFLLNEHTEPQDLVDLIGWFRSDKDIGLISDAGCPGVADPGAQAVRIAHGANWRVQPHVGPSSILLALMASGLNGQSFAFKGYLPRDNSRRERIFREFKDGLQKRKETAIFMEPPYRNDPTFKELIDKFPEDLTLCVAADLTLESEWIRSMSIRDWRREKLPSLHKRPCLFLLGT